MSRLAASYNFLIKVILDKDVTFPFDCGSVMTSSSVLPPKDLFNLYVCVLDCLEGNPLATFMTFPLRYLRSFVFRDLIAGLGSENHRRRERSSRKGRYSMAVLHVIVESREFSRKPELLVLSAAFFWLDTDGTQPDLLSSSPFDETWRIEVKGKARFVKCCTSDPCGLE